MAENFSLNKIKKYIYKKKKHKKDTIIYIIKQVQAVWNLIIGIIFPVQTPTNIYRAIRARQFRIWAKYLIHFFHGSSISFSFFPYPIISRLLYQHHSWSFYEKKKNYYYNTLWSPTITLRVLIDKVSARRRR